MQAQLPLGLTSAPFIAPLALPCLGGGTHVDFGSEPAASCSCQTDCGSLRTRARRSVGRGTSGQTASPLTHRQSRGENISTCIVSAPAGEKGFYRCPGPPSAPVCKQVADRGSLSEILPSFPNSLGEPLGPKGVSPNGTVGVGPAEGLGETPALSSATRATWRPFQRGWTPA